LRPKPLPNLWALAWAFLFYFVFKTLHSNNHTKIKNHKIKSQVRELYRPDFFTKICNNLLNFQFLIKIDFVKNFQHSANSQNCQNFQNLLKKLCQKLEKFKPSGWN
jgi:ribosomal protein S20